MAWQVPDKGEGMHNHQSIVYGEYMEVILAALTGDCVLSGCAVTAQGVPNMTAAVAKGAVLTNGVLKAIAAANVTIGAADATNPRFDLVVIDSTGAKAVRAGTAAATPKPPVRNTNDVVIAVVYVPATDTAVDTAQIVDLRVMRTQGPITIAKQTTAVTFNTSLAQQTYFSVTLPSGLFLAGKSLHVRCGGSYLANSGAPIWTLQIDYGGTTMFSDAVGAMTLDADRGAWALDFTIQAQANADQALNGIASFQTPGAKTASTGTGDLGVVTSVVTPINGAAAVDSDAADRTLNVRWTMSVSNVADETVMEFATAELV